MSFGEPPDEPICGPADFAAARFYACRLGDYIDSTVGDLTGTTRNNLRKKLSKWWKRANGQSEWFNKHGNRPSAKVHMEPLPPGLGRDPYVVPRYYEKAWERYREYDRYLKANRGKISKTQRANLRRKKAMWKRYAEGKSPHFEKYGSGPAPARTCENTAVRINLQLHYGTEGM